MDKKPGYIRFSNSFCNYREIHHWRRMDISFLEKFPEFYDGVTPEENICPQLKLSCWLRSGRGQATPERNSVPRIMAPSYDSQISVLIQE